MDTEISSWLQGLKEKSLLFLASLKSTTREGYYKYSLTGDLYSEKTHWNVGSSVFALKIFYTLGIAENEDIIKAADYIKSFQKDNGLIYDGFIYKKSIFFNMLESIRSVDFSNFFNQRYKIAEARQSFSALSLYDLLPEKIYNNFPQSEDEIDAYLSSLNWHIPWGAGSAFSHLMFYLNLGYKKGVLDKAGFDRLTAFAAEWINKIQHEEDGCWYKGNVKNQQKINGAMKIITGFVAAGKLQFNYADKLLDLCLQEINNKHACDNLNIILVINYANQVLGQKRSSPALIDFVTKRLETYKDHYHEKEGGFSFYKNRSNSRYYGAKITRGLNEPDIHGTVLFLWGVALMTEILGIRKDLGFEIFTT